MEGLFIEYKDPLFGIIIFFTLVFTISFFSYWWSRFKSKDNEKSLDKFIKSFHALPSKGDLDEILSSEVLSFKSLYLLASSYIQKGDYDKGIIIYNSILNQKISADERKETMFLLGQAYLKAGFLERSKELFLEILSRYPRTPPALQFLLIIYEKMRDFKHAMEILEPLEEMEQNINKDATYLTIISMQYDPDLQTEEKMQKLLHWYQEHRQLGYIIFEYIFKNNPSLAWEHLDQGLCERISDILWNLQPDQLDLDIISSNAYLRELYTAKGYVQSSEKSSIFELDVLINLQLKGYQDASLQFEYLCDSCKQIFPFSFHRCPHCLGIDTVQNEMVLTKTRFEPNLSFN